MDGLNDGTFYMTNELRVYNFKPELTPLLAYAAALQNNPTLQTIGFARNRLSEDTCAAILQQIYFNQALKTVDFNGNPITISNFRDNYIKPYFSTRPDL